MVTSPADPGRPDRVRGGRPRVGLVLGAGGFAGTAFHAGVLTALAREVGWDARDAEVVVGTSAGSTSAALLRAGFPPGDYVNRITGEPMSEEGQRVLRDVAPVSTAQPRPRLGNPLPASVDLLRRAARRPWAVRPGALFAAALPVGMARNEGVATSLAPLHPEGWPERAMWICAVRLDTGARVVFGRDADAPPVTVGQAVQASCAIPSYFEPLVVDGVRYVDGGVWSLCNLDVLADAALDLVVVSAPMSTTAWIARDRDAVVRTAARAQLEWELRRVRARGTPVLVLQPAPATRTAMAGAAMDPARRPAIARHVRDNALRDLSPADAALLDRLTPD